MRVSFEKAPLARLFLAQALYWSCAIMGVILNAVAGLELAGTATLATLPLGLMALGYLASVQPLARLMQRRGRRLGFMLGSLAGIGAGLAAALALQLSSFILFCLSMLVFGVYQASAMFYRFAAVEAVPEAFRGRATAWVISGGVLAALCAPGLAGFSQGVLATPFVASYLLLAMLAVLGLLVLAGLAEPSRGQAPSATGAAPGYGELLKRPVVRAAIVTTAVGHGLMILVMNATPLAMHGHGMSVEASAEVIRWHVLGMFLPAFVAGPLIDRLGGRRVAVIGAVTMAASALVALSGNEHGAFLLSSCLLGVAWNLMLVAGTTLLGSGHDASERASAQGLMELLNGGAATAMSFASGALIASVGWSAVNLGVLPLIIWVLALQIRGRQAQQRAVA